MRGENKRLLFISTILLLIQWISVPSIHANECAEYPMMYDSLIKDGIENLRQENYKDALYYFQKAQTIGPVCNEPRQYINLVKRLIDQEESTEVIEEKKSASSKKICPKKRVIEKPLPVVKSRPPQVSDRQNIINSSLNVIEENIQEARILSKPDNNVDQSKEYSLPKSEIKERALQTSLPQTPVLDQSDVTKQPSSKETQQIVPLKPTSSKQDDSSAKQELNFKQTKPDASLKKETLEEPPVKLSLNEKVWSQQPNTPIEIPFQSKIIIEGSNIRRYLIVTPGFFEITQTDKDHLLVNVIAVGRTFLHIWDNKGRWTFDVKTILPPAVDEEARRREKGYDSVGPLHLLYSTDWNSFYRSSHPSKPLLQSMSYMYHFGVEGDVPLGILDSSIDGSRDTDGNIKVNGYTVGLTEGKIWKFEDVTLRGFDVNEFFSNLSIPGEYIKNGVLSSAKIFNRNLGVTYLYGRESSYFGLLPTGGASNIIRDEFVTGTRVELFPEKDNGLAFNYARGFGRDRPDYLSNKVYSTEGRFKIKDFSSYTEWANDTEDSAMTISNLYSKGPLAIGANFRNIEDDFTTISGYPAGQGEIGGNLSLNWTTPNETILTSYLDVYQNRFLPNPIAENELNYDFNSSVSTPFTENGRWENSIYYTHTPQEISPRRDLRFISNYTKSIPVWLQRTLVYFLQGSLQRSRFSATEISDYDRYSVMSGVSVPIIPNVSLFTNYEYSLVNDLQSEKISHPNVLNAGVQYSQNITDEWAVTSSFDYRNEEDTESINSFLAGEDSISGGFGLTYRPYEIWEIYFDGRMRNVWAQQPDRDDYNELDLRGGVRIDWASPVTWNPKGTVEGFVFKDLNSNHIREMSEPGVPNVEIQVGYKKGKTDENGHYAISVRAKSADVSINVKNLPQGFILTTPVTQTVKILSFQKQLVNFGVSTKSGVYGVAFVDTNNNGRPESGEELIPKMKIKLDNTQETASDVNGAFFFQNMKPGKHTMKIDVNSIPVEFLPKIKLEKSFELKEGETFIFYVPFKKK